MDNDLTEGKKFLLQFATSNIHKVEEVKMILEDYPITIEQINAKTLEIQADKVEDVAKTSVIYAVQERGVPMFVEDTGLFIDALSGFPGPYASYIYKTIGRKGVLKLLCGVFNRSAEFRSVVAFCIPMMEPVFFLGTVFGKISTDERGNHGFGFDSIFEPNFGKGKTFAEMALNEKINFSHRAQSVKKFAEWYLKHYKPLKKL